MGVMSGSGFGAFFVLFFDSSMVLLLVLMSTNQQFFTGFSGFFDIKMVMP